MYDFDDAKGRWHCSFSAFGCLSYSTPLLADHILTQMPYFYQQFQVILKCPALLGGMPLIPIITAIQILVPPSWISTHFTGPTEIRLMLDLLQDFMYRFFKIDVYPFCSANGVLPPDLSSRLLLKAPCFGFLLVLKHSRGLPFIL